MGNKSLVIAEKPSVAGDLVKVLPGKFTKSKTHYEGDDYIVSFSIGHLVSICYPEEIDPKYKPWTLDNLPIIPEVFPLKAIQDTKSQLNALQKLIRRKDVDTIINACDAGREGELIFKYILNFTGNKAVAKKTIKRLWLQSMTKDAIKDGFAHLRDDQAMKALEATAMCRSESDWLIGINASRALSAYRSRRGGFFLNPCGRVQTPTLSLIVRRERERKGFIPQTYHELLATFVHDDQEYRGKWIDPEFKKNPDAPHARQDRFWDGDSAADILQRCLGKVAQVTETSKESSQRSPLLYDLTSLQREANSRFGFSARNTLAIAQALYERHKAVTYPRTDSRHLPEDYLAGVQETMASQTSGPFGRFAEEALAKHYIKKDKRIFNNKKISDHHAIIPTQTAPKSLSEPETKIYHMIVQRFLAVFFPAAVFLNTRRLSLVENETFLTEGKILKQAGWKSIYGNVAQDEDDTILAPVPPAATVNCRDIEQITSQTTPPPRYSEATLLSAMENSDKLVEDEELKDALKERGLGTPATRASIIEGLIKDKYVVREGRELAPTGKAFDLLSLIEGMGIEELASPDLTGEWEYKLNQLLKGEFTREAFMDGIRQLTSKIVDKVKNFNSDDSKKEATFSPIAGQVFYETATSYVSADNAISLRKVLGGRVMNEEEIVDLLSGKTIGPMADFRSKKGKPFTASLQLKDNRVEFLFADSDAGLDLEEIKKSDPLGLSPIDKSPVYETPIAFMSESALDGDDQGLRISKVILSKTLEAKHIRQMLTDGKTELISGFISKKRRPFDAYLLLDGKGKITFEFPPRKKKFRKKQTEE